jgi:hypothetical protein
MFYGAVIVPDCPGETTLITPAQVHRQVLKLSRAGIFPTKTIGAPGTQGADVIGTQGTGVGTPCAAAVAATNAGLAGLTHIPKGGIFTNGTWSMMFAAGIFAVKTLFWGRTTSVDGASPNVHWSDAPMHT